MTRRIDIPKEAFIAYNEFITDSEWVIAVDVGHGGMLDGEYTTAPSKMYNHPWGTFYEGVFNRQVAMAVSEKLMEHSLSHFFTTDSNLDVSLPIRTTRANNYVRKYPKRKHLFISIHGNAHSNQNARGLEIWTSPGQTKSDEYAEVFYEELTELGWRMRSDISDGDADKESRFYVLVKTKSPAVLLELGFYSNPIEAKDMMSPKVQDQMANAIVKSILKIIENEKTK